MHRNASHRSRLCSDAKGKDERCEWDVRDVGFVTVDDQTLGRQLGFTGVWHDEIQISDGGTINGI